MKYLNSEIFVPKMATNKEFKRLAADTDVFYRLKFLQFAKIVCLLPFSAMTLCVGLSCLLHWDKATETHCKVTNYLPSISASIGDFTPQRYIWRIAIALHSAPRFLTAIVYLCFYKKAASAAWISKLAHLGFLFNVLENVSLLGLSYVSSSENFDFHEAAFVGFVVCSIVYMMISCLLLKVISQVQNNHKLRKSFTLKVKIMVFYMSMFALVVYFYFRHNDYCEPGVYSLFALCEYLVVIGNIAFHYTSVYDLEDASIHFGPLVYAYQDNPEKYR